VVSKTVLCLVIAIPRLNSAIWH